MAEDRKRLPDQKRRQKLPADNALAARIASMSDDDYHLFRVTEEGQRAIARAMGGALED